MMAPIAAIPEAKAHAVRAALRGPRGWLSSARRVGFCVRAYSNPLCWPSSSWTYVDVWKIGVMIAPVDGSGSWPA